MRFRDFVISCCFLALTAILGAILWQAPSGRTSVRIDPIALNSIEIGMTRGEVEAIIGGPPADYTGGRVGVLHFTRTTMMNQCARTGERWEIQVRIDDKNQVAEKDIQETIALPLAPSIWQHIREILKI